MNKIHFSGVTNTKMATVLATMGVALKKPGIYITYDKDNPRSTGGQAHFLFEDLAAVDVLSKVYEASEADAELEGYLEDLIFKLDASDHAELETKIRNAIIVYGRKFLDNYQSVVRSLKEDIAKYVVIGGTPVFDRHGHFAGVQDFTVKGVKE